MIYLARVKFLLTGKIDDIWTDCIKELKDNPPKDKNDFDNNKPYTACTRGKNGGEIISGVQIAFLCDSQEEMDKLSSKARSRFQKMNYSTMARFKEKQLENNDSSADEEKDEESENSSSSDEPQMMPSERKRKKCTKKKKDCDTVSAADKEAQETIIKNKLSTLVSGSVINTEQTSASNVRAEVSNSSNVPFRLYEEMVKKCNQLQKKIDYYNKVPSDDTSNGSYISLEVYNEMVEKCNELIIQNDQQNEEIKSLMKSNSKLDDEILDLKKTINILNEKLEARSKEAKNSSIPNSPQEENLHMSPIAKDKGFPINISAICSTPVRAQVSAQKGKILTKQNKNIFTDSKNQEISMAVEDVDTVKEKEKLINLKTKGKSNNDKEQDNLSDDSSSEMKPLQKYTVTDENGLEKKMIYFIDQIAVTKDTWDSLSTMEDRLFCKNILRKLYNKEEIVKRSVSGEPNLMTPKGTHSRKIISPNKKNFLTKCLASKIDHDIKTGVKHKKNLTKPERMKQLNEHLSEEIRKKVLKKKKELKNAEE